MARPGRGNREPGMTACATSSGACSRNRVPADWLSERMDVHWRPANAGILQPIVKPMGMVGEEAESERARVQRGADALDDAVGIETGFALRAFFRDQ